MTILINGEKIKIENFYSHELKILKNKSYKEAFSPKVDIIVNYIHETKGDNAKELLTLLLVLKNIFENTRNKVILEFNYLPFSRMDKPEELLIVTLSPFLNILNDLATGACVKPTIIFNTVHTNKVGDENNFIYIKVILNRWKVIFEDPIFDEVHEKIYDHMSHWNSAYYVAVDNGVKERYKEEEICFDIIAQKKRDENGKIIEHTIDLSTITDAKEREEKTGIPLRFVMIDDICSAGNTFTNIAKQIKKEFPTAEVHLFVQFMEKEAYDAKINKDLFNEDIIKSITFNTFI